MRNLWLQMTGHAPEPVWMSVLGCLSIFGGLYLFLVSAASIGGLHG